MKKSLFITGATGFLGGHLISQASENWQVYATYRKKIKEFPLINWIELDLNDLQKIEQTLMSPKIDVLIHAAAIADLDRAEGNIDLTHRTNILATQKIAELCESQKIRLIFISTDMVFDGEKGNYSENDGVNPLNYYGITKQIAENFISKYCSNYVIARSALIYGFSLTGSKTFSEIMLDRTKSGESVQLFTDQYRTPILVDNLAQALLELAASEYCGTMHLGGADRISRYDFGILFAKYFSISSNLLIPTQMKNFQFKAARPKDTSFKIDLAQKILKTEIWDCHRGVQFMKNCPALRH